MKLCGARFDGKWRCILPEGHDRSREACQLTFIADR